MRRRSIFPARIAFALLAAAFSAPVDAAVLGKLRHASEVWAQGDKCLAQIHLEHLRLPKLESEEQAFGLFLADRLIASVHSPRDLCEALGFDLPEGLKKYNPEEPRDDHGRWTTGGASGSSTGDAPPRAGSSRSADAPGIAAASSAEAAAGVAAEGTQAAAGVAAEGTILGPLSAEAHAGLGAPIARAVGGSVVIDPGAVRAAAAPKEKQQDDAGAKANAEAKTDTKREEPKLCPDPGPENITGRKAFDIQYEQYVRSIANPQRQPPLPVGLAFSLTNPATGQAVRFDDCRESDGTMIEAKGHYEHVRRSQFLRDEIDGDWIDQATRQVDASGGRDIEWYFHEQAAADTAQKLFRRVRTLRRIRDHYLPDPAGIPNPNARIK